MYCVVWLRLIAIKFKCTLQILLQCAVYILKSNLTLFLTFPAGIYCLLLSIRSSVSAWLKCLLQMWGFINNLSVPLTRRCGHLVSLPEQVSFTELCGKEQLISLLSLNFFVVPTNTLLTRKHKTPFPNSDLSSQWRRARCLLAVKGNRSSRPKVMLPEIHCYVARHPESYRPKFYRVYKLEKKEQLM